MGRFKLETIMELVNGKQKQLTSPEIVMGAMENLGLTDEIALMLVGSYIANPLSKSVQVNNTMFVYLSGNKGEDKQIVTYVYNLDVQENFHGNILKFLSIVQKRGEKGVTLVCKNQNFLGAFLKVIPILKKYDMTAGIAEKPSKKIFIARLTLGKKRIGTKK
tara:strand:+ start:567 stop:1052 length:486 start_codon:yes stop_codon:yes gene_type:complete